MLSLQSNAVGLRAGLVEASAGSEIVELTTEATVPEKPRTYEAAGSPSVIYFPGIDDCKGCIWDENHLLQPVLQWNMGFENGPSYPGEWVVTAEYVYRENRTFPEPDTQLGWLTEPEVVQPRQEVRFRIRRDRDDRGRYWRVEVQVDGSGNRTWLETTAPETKQPHWFEVRNMKSAEVAMEVYPDGHTGCEYAPGPCTFENVSTRTADGRGGLTWENRSGGGLPIIGDLPVVGDGGPPCDTGADVDRQNDSISVGRGLHE